MIFVQSSKPVESLKVIILIKVAHILIKQAGVKVRVVIIINSSKVFPETPIIITIVTDQQYLLTLNMAKYWRLSRHPSQN